jgi:hypothetical protein
MISVSLSVADPEGFFRIQDPDFFPSRISDPTTTTKEEGGENLLSNLLSWSQILKI